MKKTLTILAVAVISVLSINSCSKGESVATKFIFNPESLTVKVGETKTVEFSVDGTQLPSGATAFGVLFLCSDLTKIRMTEAGVNYVKIQGIEPGTVDVTAMVENPDPRDEGITGTLRVTVVE